MRSPIGSTQSTPPQHTGSTQTRPQLSAVATAKNAVHATPISLSSVVMGTRPPIFISSTSDLRPARALVGKVLYSMGYDPVWQDIEPTEGGELLEKLRQRVRRTQRMIQLVGDRYGAEPPAPSPEFGRVSYTQFEARFAEKLGHEVIYLFVDPQLAPATNHPTAPVDTSNDRVRPGLPWFIVLFVLASVSRSLFPAIESVAPTLRTLAITGLTVALFLIGTSLSRPTLKAVGLRPMLQGATLWLIVSALTLGVVILQG